MPRLISVGECMVELSDAGGGLLRKGFAGDTFNMAWYARKLLPSSWSVGYVSAVGDDVLSSDMLTFMAQSGVDTRGVRRITGKSPGLYLISLKDGERSFSYWRDTSAARQMADDPSHLASSFADADVIHLSGITLGILTPGAAHVLLGALRDARRRGARVSFDTNYRPRLWQGRNDAAQMFMAAAAVSSVVLPGLDDEAAVFGPCSVDDVAARYRGAGAETVVVKNGADGAHVFSGEAALHVPAAKPRALTDTTAAGDSFAAGFLARLVMGSPASDAAKFAAEVAAAVVSERGALVQLPAHLTSGDAA